MNKGWIKSYRALLDNPVVTKTTDHMAVWIFLIHTATSKEHKAIFKGEEIILKPGQLITGRKIISEKYKNLNESKVQRVLKDFENAHQIEQQTSSQNRLITLLNWEKYQTNEQRFEQRANNERTTSEQRANNERTHNKKDKEYKRMIDNEREGELSPLGQFKNVLLSQTELDDLMSKYPNDCQKKIERLSRYLASTGKHYQNHFATLLDWLETDEAAQPKKKSESSIDYDKLNKLSIPDV